MDIAIGVKCKDWKRLKLDDPHSKDWNAAIAILKSRIEARYIQPVDILIDCDEQKPYEYRTFGFTILAIDSLLIETLQAFKDGRKSTKKYDGKCAFVRFLTSSPSMKRVFKHNIDLAEKYYTHYRCGILHQAEIKENSLVWSIGGECAFFKEDDNNPGIKQMVVNRTKFHKNLKSDFINYLSELEDTSNKELRSNFRKKMDYICGGANR